MPAESASPCSIAINSCIAPAAVAPASNVGRQLTAVLSALGPIARTEILRVEDAQTDSRIEAEICRQFDALALLLIPIYRDRAMIGVLEVFFDEPHTFDEREVRSYHLMASLVGDATSLPVLLADKRPAGAPTSTVAHALWRMSTENPAPTKIKGPVAVPAPEPEAVVRSFSATATASFRNLLEPLPLTGSDSQSGANVTPRFPLQIAVEAGCSAPGRFPRDRGRDCSPSHFGFARCRLATSRFRYRRIAASLLIAEHLR